jgi:hypothetical protein
MSFIQKENLPKSMITGKKRSLNQSLAIKSSHFVTGLFLLIIIFYLFWMLYAGVIPELTL